MAAANGNLGSVYETRGELDRATENWQKSLILFTEVGATREMAQVQSLLDDVSSE